MVLIVLIICCFYIFGIFKIIGGIIDFIHSLSNDEDFRLAFIPFLVYGFIEVIFLYGFFISCELLIFIGVFLFIDVCIWFYIVNKRQYKVKYDKINNLSEMEDTSYIKCSNYVIEYADEFEFRKLERVVKKYQVNAYKEFIFKYIPSFKDGNFSGYLAERNIEEGFERYELKLTTDEEFAKVHSNILLHYIVYFREGIVVLDSISPKDFFTEGHQEELTIYKGVPITNSHGDSDMFKIDLLNMLEK